ncbi:hypothetical protein [Falsirhodobacter halotolerans]|uniref:hypothetical protein n=1 Tax=Falsirhodobacter halotolerans TaxID=1146892 RepID=UPI001FD1F334|nr:hypothetical protein [Falsirhodobacter halotolerans]MCJ8138592.1 hypothetical protein [Falsirhodobacter halotolerans]
MKHDRYAAQIAAATKAPARTGQISKDQAKKARQRERKHAKRDASAAVTADIWQDREGKARPTDERRARGAWVLRDGEEAGVTVAVDEHAHVLDQMLAKKLITADQCLAGHDFAALMERTRMVSAGRSCLDFTPVGYEGDNDPTHGELRDASERKVLYAQMGSWVWSEMRMVCHQGFWPDRLDRLREGLDMAAKYWAGKR